VKRILLSAAFAVMLVSGLAARAAEEPGAAAGVVEPTPALVREIQFMLLRLGMEPGPIDGVPGPQTRAAVHRFEQKFGLPDIEAVSEQGVSGAFLARLRGEASRAIFGPEQKAEPTQPPPSPPPAVAVAPAMPPPPTPAPPVAPPAPPAAPPDKYAACPYDPQDFRIGGVEYTPDKFLREGFDGSTARAVANLKDRLDEARKLAENIGGSALTEVQRQSRVLNYFSCRLKIEQAAADKK
jgi:peptidoglycan hydrolase-like protein with peptidoglycan-binding domain